MLWWLAQNALAAGLLAGLVTLVCRFVRLSPAVQHALWLVVLIKLVTPPLLLWPWPLPGFGESLLHDSVAEHSGVAANDRSFDLPLPSEEAEDSPPQKETTRPPRPLPDLEEDARPSKPSAATPSPKGEWLILLVQSFWLAGSGFLGVLHIIRIARFRRLLRQTEPAPSWLEELVANVAGTLGVRRPHTLLMHDSGSPCVWGLGRPKLLWPAGLLERLPRSGQRSIVTHELAHLRRRDHWVGWLQLIAECVWWWNPLFWYVRRQLRFHAELACDAWVVATLPEERRTYAEALIEITQLVSQKAAPLPALGIRSAARQDFERRLTMIMRDRVPCRVPHVALVAVGVLALVSLPGWSQSPVEVQAVPKIRQAPAHEEAIILRVPIETAVAVKLVQETDGDHQPGVDAQPGSRSERDRRIERLEKRLEELLQEVQALRAGGTKPQQSWKLAPASKPGQRDQPGFIIIDKRSDGKHAPAPGYPQVGKPDIRPEKTYTYTDKKKVERKETEQATYLVPFGNAEALMKLLTALSKVPMEFVYGESRLTVTTTPEAQAAIRQFLHTNEVKSVIFSPDGKTIIEEGSPDGVRRILDAKSGKIIRQEKLPAEGQKSIGERKK
jgi:beta-lactamase regulating signal transducer with metallopeptidase domain